MGITITDNSNRPLISPGSSSYSIYDPTLPNRILAGTAQAPTPITSTDPGQGPQYNPSFGADTSPTPTPSGPATALTYPSSFAATGDYAPSSLGSALASAAQPPAARNMPFPGQVDPRGVFAPKPVATRPAVVTRGGGMAGANVNGIFNNLPDDTFNGANSVQTAQAPASATPQGWNLFAAIGQALGHLLGYNASGQPQGMSGLVRNPVQAAPTQTAALRMPTGATRYQGRTLLG